MFDGLVPALLGRDVPDIAGVSRLGVGVGLLVSAACVTTAPVAKTKIEAVARIGIFICTSHVQYAANRDASYRKPLFQ
jgi:hypothetical protein